MRYLYPSQPNRIDINSDLMNQLDDNEDWVAERKKNGWRCELYREGKLTLWTRKQTIIQEALPSLRTELLKMVPEGTIIDGELLEKRTKNVKELFYAFDILCYRNISCLKYPWYQRRLLLEHVIHDIPGLIEISRPIVTGKKNLYYDSIQSDDVEGIVMKKIDSPYIMSLKDSIINPFWLKVKKPEKYEFVGRK